MSHLHPLAPQVLPYCSKYPTQAAALYQVFIDLSLAQGWQDVQVVELVDCDSAVVSGRPKKGAAESIVYPAPLGTPTTLSHFSKLFKALAARSESPAPPAPTELSPASSSAATPPSSTMPSAAPGTLFLAIAEKDSTVVYYVLRDGIVSPKEVPE